MDFKKYIEDIKDFPEEGIIFRDVTPLLKDKEAYKESIDTFAKWIDGLGVQVDVVAGPEARGFLFGCPVAYKVNAGFVPVRKPGKLPRETVSTSYDLEYGKNEVQIELIEQPDLIGGFVIRVKDREEDWSMKGRLNKLKQELIWR